jgi:hypothetical protein
MDILDVFAVGGDGRILFFLFIVFPLIIGFLVLAIVLIKRMNEKRSCPKC